MTEPAAPVTPARVVEAMADFGLVTTPRRNRVRIVVSRDRIRDGLLRVQGQLACDHVVHIAAVDNGSTFELHYSLTGPHRLIVTLAVAVPRDDARVVSVHDLLPPAGIYERQIHDLFGIVFEGHPNLKRLILTEDWPEGEYPLRKDWKMDPNRSYGGAVTEAK